MKRHTEIIRSRTWNTREHAQSGRIGGFILWLAIFMVLLGALYFVASGGKNLLDVDLWSEEGREDIQGVAQTFLSRFNGNETNAATERAKEISNRPFTLQELSQNKHFWPEDARLTANAMLTDGTVLEAGETLRVTYISPTYIRLSRGSAWTQVPMDQTDVEASVRQKIYDAALTNGGGGSSIANSGSNQPSQTRRPPQSANDNTVPPVMTHISRSLRANEKVQYLNWYRLQNDVYDGQECYSVRVKLILSDTGADVSGASSCLDSYKEKTGTYTFYLNGNTVLGTDLVLE